MNFLLPVAATAISLSFVADDPKVIQGGQIQTPPTIDGTVNTEEWKGAFSAEGFNEQNTDKPSKYNTKFFAAYDKDSLYFAFICTDPQPSLIRMTEYRRQASVGSDDRILLLINANGTYQESEFSQFEFNAIGGNTARLAGGRSDKVEWQGEWQSVGRRTDTGYEVEVRIPWKILYPPAAGKRRVVINFGREVPRDSEVSIWSNIGPQELMARNAVWQDVEIPAVKKEKLVQALPYVITGYDDKFTVRSGVDLRYLPTNQITTLVTVNPDFANIEGALLGVEFSRFERLADERRPFFVEGADYFRIGGMSAQLFSPQRIRAIDVGAKAFGILPNELDFGALVTTKVGDENVGVFRLKKGFGRSSIVGGYVGSERNGIENHAMGIQGNYVGPRFSFFSLFNATSDSVVGTGERVDFDVNFNDGRWFSGLGWQTIDSNFEPRFGFAPRRGYKGYSGHLGYESDYSSGPLNSFSFFSSATDRQRIDGKGVFSRGFEVGVEAQMRNGLAVEAFVADFEFFDSSDRFGGAEVKFPHTDPYHQFGIGYFGGTVADQNYSEIFADIRWRFPNRLTVSAAAQLVGFAGDNEFQHVVGLSYELSRYQSVVGRAVIQNDSTNWYLSYRHSGNKGLEYFVILGDPNAETFQDRLIIKLVAPVSFRL